MKRVYKKYAQTHPHISLSLDVESDPDALRNIDPGEMIPAHNDPFRAEVNAMCIVKGEVIEHSEHLGGLWAEHVDDLYDNELNGYLPQMAEEAVQGLLELVGDQSPVVDEEAALSSEGLGILNRSFKKLKKHYEERSEFEFPVHAAAGSLIGAVASHTPKKQAEKIEATVDFHIKIQEGRKDE